MSQEAKVRSILVEVVHQVSPESTAAEAARKMVEADVGCLIVSRPGTPVGIVTEKDLLRKVMAAGADPKRVRVADVMSVPLISVVADTSIGDAAQKMIQNKIKRLGVVGENRAFLGIVTMTDIVRWVANQEELHQSLVNYLNYDVP